MKPGLMIVGLRSGHSFRTKFSASILVREYYGTNGGGLADDIMTKLR